MAESGKIRMALTAAILALSVCSNGCGSGGATSGGSAPDPAVVTEAVEWTPPTTFYDNTPLNPRTDLSHYDIYVGTSPTFTDNDAPLAAVAAVSTETGSDGTTPVLKATSSFNLTHLAPFVEPGRSYYVSVRAVGTDNLVSSFSTPVEWDLG